MKAARQDSCRGSRQVVREVEIMPVSDERGLERPEPAEPLLELSLKTLRALIDSWEAGHGR